MTDSIRFGSETSKRPPSDGGAVPPPVQAPPPPPRRAVDTQAKTGLLATVTPKVERAKEVIVDEERSVSIQVLYSTITFRPNQKLRDARLIELAKEYGISLRYK